jgi:hypothetical protein
VGLIVDADKQLLRLEAAVEEVLRSVPQEFKDGFVFHATDIWGSRKFRDRWAFSDRFGLLKRMMALPQRAKCPLTVSFVRRSSGRFEGLNENVTTEQYHHYQAFANCMASADKYIRDHAGLEEVGTVVAEDCPPMRKFLKSAVRLWRDTPYVLPPKMLQPTAEEVVLGYVRQEGEFRVERIRPNIHFVEKGDEALTQLADACAFGFRRFLSEEDKGVDFVRAILGKDPPPISDFSGPLAVDTYHHRGS